MACALLAWLPAVGVAGEAKATVRVSATVVRACDVALVSAPSGSSVGELARVDCGPRPRDDASPAFRVRLCDRTSREDWCVRLRERHRGYDIRSVRFE